MKNKFLSLPEETRINAFNQIAEKKGITPFAVEKDWWVTQSLSIIFAMEEAEFLVFKGGTSLSKSWNLIQRFSEDVDLAIDREFLGFTEIPKRKTNLRKKSGKFVAEEFYPKLQKCFEDKGIAEDVIFTLENVQSSDQDPRIINIYYPSIIETKGYLNPRVQIEIGCRSLKEPFSNCLISSFVDQEYKDLDFSSDEFLVPSVNPERTFLEKIFLLHEEFQKPHDKIRVNRLSRHLYDIYSLYHSEFKDKALQDEDLYKTIVHHRIEFTKVAGVDYSLHNPQTINPIPPDSIIKQWEEDYETMKSEMLYSEHRPEFSEIIDTLEKLKSEINKLEWVVF
ncbi:nucleotidyl transferase AbiEii/AbiGii toxin family protein [Chryseobacterium gotjawalense]|uniref:Nucleotidyl transferase AbiEii/AbiGii toxin family protein n=1 Tax=Chryseobacterium gotjawalense TaxID=3042315 RepID=A0ABY8RCP5_9FLAO|nr:nucleotidyl transferase AbiEii/AbiGii toxin family protein [Chryseobacterium sp. wdc7]WHF51269.1 nucleotidyl transferase AbiEii/AbiGii toxin family protein [Chryseobacterium sp. wdc7]